MNLDERISFLEETVLKDKATHGRIAGLISQIQAKQKIQHRLLMALLNLLPQIPREQLESLQRDIHSLIEAESELAETVAQQDDQLCRSIDEFLSRR